MVGFTNIFMEQHLGTLGLLLGCDPQQDKARPRADPFFSWSFSALVMGHLEMAENEGVFHWSCNPTYRKYNSTDNLFLL